jgi:hypothetical protein
VRRSASFEKLLVRGGPYQPRQGAGDGVRDGGGFAFGFLVGDAEGGVVGVEEFTVAPAVSLEGDGGGVEGAAVGLDYEAVVGPEEVDLDAAIGDLDRGIEKRGREVAMEEQRQHLGLEGAFKAAFLGDGRRTSPVVDESAQRLHPAPPRIHRRLDRRDVEDLPLRRPLEAASQRPVAHGAGKVDERSRGARAGDAIHGPALVQPRGTDAVKANPIDLASPLWRRDDVDDHGTFVEQAEQRSSAAMGDDRIRASEGGCSKSSAGPDVLVSQGVDAAEDSMQASSGNLAADHRVAHPEAPQLLT